MHKLKYFIIIACFSFFLLGCEMPSAGQEGFYGFSIIDKQVLQIAIYFDEKNDFDWAKEIWKNIKLKK
ncbi:hypothetical protein [Pedobacter aquatilis]|uniref:hypothetical protein n=1 Tax=Pedobacter aquatilis TaxID=351343 RepID=UPI002931B72A|nr:hypothetical protein [Pedobacter aquatilis]